MLEILYYIFIFPVEQVLEWALFTLFKATKNYGISIILLSLIMQLFMLKLTFYFDKKATSFGALKAQCDSKIKEFKRVFKGAELQSYIRTLYKQRHFHPIFTLFGLGGLALQIPFFIAMIHLVENAEYLQSVRFLWIDDLSKPDSIMLFGLSIHILPLLMTAFTLINVFYSSKELGARVQGSLIALLFLVLLYSMPSALVLYWTCNIAFALFKEIFKHKKHSSLSNHSQDCVSLEAVITTKVTPAPKSTQNSQSNTAITRMCESADRIGVECQVSNVSNLNQDTRIADSLSCHTEQSEVSKKRDSNNANSSKNTKLSGKATQPQGKLKTILFNIFTPHAALDSKTYTTYRNISILAILNICFMICVFSPYAIYSSDVSQFDISQTYQTLGALFGFFILSSFGLIYFTSFFYKTRLLKIGVYGVSVILCIGLVYTFVLDYNVATGQSYGGMEAMMFVDPSLVVNTRMSKFVDIGVILSVAIIFAWLFYIAYRVVLSVFGIVICTLLVVSSIYMYQIFGNISDTSPSQHQALHRHDVSLSEPDDNLTLFSRENLNIIVLMLDAFTGSHLKIILEEYPFLVDELDGFTYYDNTTTAASYTHTSLPSVFGGEHYSVYQINKRKPQDLESERNEGVSNIVNAFLANDFQVGLDLYAVSSQAIGERIRYNKHNYRFSPKHEYGIWLFENDTNFNLNTLVDGIRQEITFSSFISYGLFKFVPYVPRVKLVLDVEAGMWKLFNNNRASIQTVRDATQHIAQLHYLANSVSIGSTKPTLKFISNLTSHDSFVLDIETCVPVMFPKGELPDKYKAVIPRLFWPKFNSEVCAFREIVQLIQNLKANKIYNNTLFIVVSDHGRSDSYPQLQIAGDKFPGAYTDTLLLIKQPNSKGALKVDSRLMVNADVAGIICDYIGGCSNVGSNVLKTYLPDREIIHAYPSFWIGTQNPKTHYSVESFWKVKGDIYNPNNWENITEQVRKDGIPVK